MSQPPCRAAERASELSDVTLSNVAGSGLLFVVVEPFTVAPPPKPANNSSCAAEITGRTLTGCGGGKTDAAICPADEAAADVLVRDGPAMTIELLIAADAPEAAA